jgi:hypothetical protein
MLLFSYFSVHGQVIMRLSDIWEMFKSTLDFASPPSLPTQLITYDTTCKLGDFYLSALLYRQTDFDPAPVIPLALLLHERKLASTHESFFEHVTRICPEVDRAKNVIVVTDGETAITSALAKNLPKTPSFLCWNHILQVSQSNNIFYYNLGVILQRLFNLISLC